MIIGFLIFILYLDFFVGFKQILAVLETVNPIPYWGFYFFAVCTLVVGIFFWSASWKTVLSTLSVEISMKNAFLYYWVGYFVDLLSPARRFAGKLRDCILFTKKPKVTTVLSPLLE
jgi:uncharacterized membrane protein YbhN (UPF0104 family)